jgi:hypothetical protein
MRKGILLFMLLVVLTGCKTKYVAVPEYHNVYVEKHYTLVHRDSIFEKDSVLIMMNGDTVTIYKTKILYKDRWRERIVYRDSIRTDSIRVPYPVEKELTFWQKTWIKAGKMLFYGLVIICIIFWLVYVLRVRRKC